MESTPMPEPLRRAIHQLVSEAVANCQEVLRYTESDQAHTWKRMTLYRATDAADTMNMVAMLIAAYCQRTGMGRESLETYLQLEQTARPGQGAGRWGLGAPGGLLGEEAPVAASEPGTWASMQFRSGRRHATNAQKVEDDPSRLFTGDVLHGLKARLCDDIASLDSYLPPHVAELAKKVVSVLEEPQPASV
ncbi:hypothetical protein ACFVT1_40090 [Streptomyces sp. NPDC057963]|uniref:hypothetical protein n=1 Tax=Streptomyces sp. NPDC057963 TaxID=3346290 RepID=UPI0036ECFE0C